MARALSMAIVGYGEGIVLELLDNRKRLLDMTPEVAICERSRAVHLASANLR